MKLPEWLSQGALPLGMIMTVITMSRHLLGRSGHSRAQKDYPGLAEELGLEFRPSRYRTGIGALAGEWRGRKVLVDPDERRCVRMTTRVPLGLYVASFQPTRRRKAEYEVATPTDPARYRPLVCFEGTPGELDNFWRSQAAVDLVAFARSRSVASLLIDAEAVTVTFQTPAPPFISADLVREVLTLLDHLLNELEPAGRNGAERPFQAEEALHRGE